MKQTMKSEKQYRVKLFTGAVNQLAELLTVLAAKSNGGNWVTLEQMVGIVEAKKMEFPTLYKDHTGELIGDKILHIDAPSPNPGEYQTLLSIEEIEILEVEETVEDSDFDFLRETGGLAD